MGTVYDFTELDDPADEEVLRTKKRRLFMYSALALLAAEAVERVYVMFPEFQQALGTFDRIYQLSRHLEAPQGALLTGPPGSSKTTLARYFATALPPSNLFDIGYGAIFIRLRAHPTQGLIVSLLLRALSYPFTEVRKNRIYTMRDIAFEAIRQKGTKVIFVDQAHCLSTQVRPRHADVAETSASDALRESMDETKVGLILLADAAFKGLELVDRALADRISVRLTISHFAEDAVWTAFLLAFAKAVHVIDIAIIATEPVAKATHAATGGNRRWFRGLITEGVLIAVEEGSNALTLVHLRLAFERTRGEGSTKANPYAD